MKWSETQALRLRQARAKEKQIRVELKEVQEKLQSDLEHVLEKVAELEAERAICQLKDADWEKLRRSKRGQFFLGKQLPWCSRMQKLFLLACTSPGQYKLTEYGAERLQEHDEDGHGSG